MCGRYTLDTPLRSVAEELRLSGDLPVMPPRYNIAPTQPVAVILQSPGGGREVRLMRWGLIPHWVKDIASFNSILINARAETAARKPAFRDAMKYRRCVIPASGFYEWQAPAQGAKQPHYITLKNHRLLLMAGLYEHWQDAHGNELESCAILTTHANALMTPIHQRMPVILSKAFIDDWLNPGFQDPSRLAPMLGPCAAQDMTAVPVSTLVNAPANDLPRCIEPVRTTLF